MRAAALAATLFAVFTASALAQSADPDAPDILPGARAPATTLPMDQTCLVNTEWDPDEMMMGPQDFDGVMRSLFMAWDETGDGTLTPQEYNACTSRLDLPATFVGFDHDADGAITQDEWTSAENFEAMDVNNDGALARGEFLFDDALMAEGLDDPT